MNLLGEVVPPPPAAEPVVHRMQRSASWTTLLCAFLIAGLALGLWLPRLHGPIDLRYDGGVYFVLGKSLAEGKGYRLLNEPGEPAAVQYPPGLPAWVALHHLTVGRGDDLHTARWLRRSAVLLFVGLALATFALARRSLGAVSSLLAAGVCMIHINTILLSDMLFTEVPFALATVVAAFSVGQVRAGNHPRCWEAIGAVGVVSAFALRTAGVAILAAWFLEALLRRDWRRAALRGVILFVPFLAWQGYVASVTRSEDYHRPTYSYQRAPYQFYNVTYAENMKLVDPFAPEEGSVTPGVLAERLLKNLRIMPFATAEAASTTNGFWKWAVAAAQGSNDADNVPGSAIRIPQLVLFAMIVLGMGWWCVRKEWFPVVSVGLSIGLICLTPWPGQFARYLSPLAPLLSVALVVGALSWISVAQPAPLRRFLRGVSALALIVVVAVQIFALTRIFERHRHDPGMDVPGSGPVAAFYHDRSWAEWGDAVRWIARNGALAGPIATASPQLAYLWTGREAIFPPMEIEPDRAQQLMEEAAIAYLIVDRLEFLDISWRYAGPVVRQFPDRWRQVYSKGGTSVYERQRLP